MVLTQSISQVCIWVVAVVTGALLRRHRFLLCSHVMRKFQFNILAWTCVDRTTAGWGCWFESPSEMKGLVVGGDASVSDAQIGCLCCRNHSGTHAEA